MNILVFAYAISPTKGSECSVAWNYVIHMSKYCNLTVLYGVSGEHMGDVSEMEEYAKQVGVKNVQFVSIKPNKVTSMLNWCNRHGIFQYSFYLAYNQWHKQVYEVAKKLLLEKHFDLIHFVGPIGYRVPGYLWKLNLPYMWGPIGGTNKASLILLHNANLLSRSKFCLRNTLNHIQFKYSRRLKNALKNTDILLASTLGDKERLKDEYGKDSYYLPENSIETYHRLNRNKFQTDIFHFIFIGRIEPGKCLTVLLSALCLMKHRDRCIIDIVGDGSEKEKLQQIANKKHLNNVIWHGKLPREKAIRIFNSAHLHILPSASEANSTVLFEAMSYGVPTISFDHCGMHDIINEKCGIKIPIHDFNQCVRDLAAKIDFLLENNHLFEELAQGTLEQAKNYSWDEREKFLLQYYDQTIKKFNEKNIRS